MRRVVPLPLIIALLPVALGACAQGSPAAGEPAPRRPLAVLEWNQAARELAAAHSLDPPLASHLYALLSVAQLRALSQGQPAAPEAGVAGASAAVLGRFFPQRADSIAALVAVDAERARSRGVDLETVAREMDGARRVAAALLERAAAGETGAAGAATPPEGPGRWASGRPPVRPQWGKMQPWVLRAGDELRPPAPPEYGTRTFSAAVAGVRRANQRATPRQRESVRFWADGPGTATPPGHWNQIAAGLIGAHGMDERQAAHVLALLNAGLMDAGVSCWDAKYTYWLLRPSQADSAISPLVQLPNFPSYPSGHAYFSGAAAEILGHFFPAERHRLARMAGEAAQSRVYAGLHYRFDSAVGLDYGRAIGRLAIDREQREPGLLLGP